MNKEEFIGKLQMVYVGDRNAFNEIVENNQKLKNEVIYSKVEIDRLNNIIKELEKELNKKIEAIKTIKDMLGEEAKIVNPHIEVLEIEYKYFLDKLKELKEE